MELLIENKKEEPLLRRSVVGFKVNFEKMTPSRKEIREELVRKLGVSEKLLVIAQVSTQFGTHTALGVARVYNTDADMTVERRHLLVRDNLAQKVAKKAQVKAPAKKK